MIKQIRNLDSEKIINMAVSILEQEGFKGLSMRNLASRLGIKAASLYNHFPNKVALIKQLQVYFVNPKNRLYNISFDAKTWQEFLTHKSEVVYREFMERPYTLELFSKYSGENQQTVMLFEKYMETMVGFGFSINDAAYIDNMLGIYIVGHCTFALGVEEQKKEAPDSVKFKPNPKFHTPLISKFVEMGWFDLDKCFKFAINHIIEGISSLQKKADK
ncbi:MAG TPA: TetR/AcrR family transcriptional regulator C-terminal domain-containing protein [Aquella sp.]|nr:TetR/AcrR family transcriptional regulator C-terminal domain-containing protein [Aquella sp.]